MTRWTEDQWRDHQARAAKDRQQKAATAPRKHEEEDEQTALFAWLNVAKWRGQPLSALAYAIPNGAKLAGTAKQQQFARSRLRRTGMQPGFPDVCLPIPAHPYHSLYVEMKKRHGGRVEPEQREWLAKLRWLGHDAHVAEGADHAKRLIVDYLARTGDAVVVGWTPDPQIDWSKWMEGGER